MGSLMKTGLNYHWNRVHSVADLQAVGSGSCSAQKGFLAWFFYWSSSVRIGKILSESDQCAMYRYSYNNTITKNYITLFLHCFWRVGSWTCNKNLNWEFWLACRKFMLTHLLATVISQNFSVQSWTSITIMNTFVFTTLGSFQSCSAGLKFLKLFFFCSVSDPDPDGSGFFPPIRIRVLKVRIRPLCDLNDGFDKVFGGAWPKKTVLRVLDIKYNIFFSFYCYPCFRRVFSWIWIRKRNFPYRIRIFGRSGSGLR